MIRCLSLGLLFVASSIGLSLLFSDVSKAESAYDNAYQTTDTLFLRTSRVNSQEHAHDISENWINFFYNDNPVNDKPIRWFYDGVEYNYYDPFVDGFLDTILNTDSFVISNVRTNNFNNFTQGDFVRFGFNLNNEPFDIDFTNVYPSPNTGVRLNPHIIVDLTEYQNTIDFTISTNPNTTMIISDSVNLPVNPPQGGQYPRGIYNFAINNIGEVNYPEGYIGPQIEPKSPLPVEDKTFLPEWTWSVTQEGKLTVTSQNNENANLDADAVFDLWKDSKDWQFPSTEVVDAERQRPYHSAKFEHQLQKEEQWFTVTLQYHDQFCLMEGTCESEFPEGITHIETVIFQIYWDGKSFIAGNNANGQEDCELQEDGGIYRRICNAEDQEPVIMRTLRSINSDMHGLTQIITAPLSFISSLITYNNNCTNLNLPLPSAMNRDLSLPCMTPYYQQYLGFLFNLYQTILTALVCYYCFVNTLAYVKRGQNPKNDRIEVAHL